MRYQTLPTKEKTELHKNMLELKEIISSWLNQGIDSFNISQKNEVYLLIRNLFYSDSSRKYKSKSVVELLELYDIPIPLLYMLAHNIFILRRKGKPINKSENEFIYYLQNYFETSKDLKRKTKYTPVELRKKIKTQIERQKEFNLLQKDYIKITYQLVNPTISLGHYRNLFIQTKQDFDTKKKK